MSRRILMIVLLAALNLCAFAQGGFVLTGNSNDAKPAPAAAPVKKGPPGAKTQEELAAYTQAVGSADLASFEKAEQDFETKYPESELRVLMLMNLVQRYYAQSQTAKVVELGKRALAIEPDNPRVLALTASAMIESSHATDVDLDEKINMATKWCETAIKDIDTDPYINPNMPPEQVAAMKSSFTALSEGTMGYALFLKESWADAEKHLQTAIDKSNNSPDAITVLRLAIAQDKQKKYDVALKNTDKAASLARAGSRTASLAAEEKARLTQLTGGQAAKP